MTWPIVSCAARSTEVTIEVRSFLCWISFVRPSPSREHFTRGPGGRDGDVEQLVALRATPGPRGRGGAQRDAG